MFDFASRFVKDVESNLAKVLSTKKVDVFGIEAENILEEGYAYATADGGKRIRPVCVYLGAIATGKDLSGKYDGLVRLATVVELIHSYSLVHDDLPSMDNDDYRRGKLSTHKKYGEANGILIGDGLLTKAMDIAVSAPQDELFIKSCQKLVSGAMNMVTGQALDLAEGDKDYRAIYALKTAQLISASLEAGATYAGGDVDAVRAVGEYGHHLGMAFQIADDLLDGADNSIVKSIGEEGAKIMLEAETLKAKESADKLQDSKLLKKVADMLLKRKK